MTLPKLDVLRVSKILEFYVDTCAALNGDPIKSFETARLIYHQAGIRELRNVMTEQANREQANAPNARTVIASRAASRLIDPTRPKPGTLFADFVERVRGPIWNPDKENFSEYMERTKTGFWIKDYETAACKGFMEILCGKGDKSTGNRGVFGETIIPIIEMLDNILAKSNRLPQKNAGDWKRLIQNCASSSIGSVRADASFNHYRLGFEQVKLFAFHINELLEPDKNAALGIDDYVQFPLINTETRRIDNLAVIQALRIESHIWDLVKDNAKLRTAHSDCADRAFEEYVREIFSKKGDVKNRFLIVVTDDVDHTKRLSDEARETGVEDRILVISTKDMPYLLRWFIKEVKDRASNPSQFDEDFSIIERKAIAIEAAAKKKFPDNGKDKRNGK